MEMRRKDLAVTDPAQVDGIIQACDCCRLAFADGSHPYIVPLSFGYQRENTLPVFYFHGAKTGRKADLIRTCGYAGFELDTDRCLNPGETACDFSFRYQSVLGEGEIIELTDLQEKQQGLQVIMQHYSNRNDWEIPANIAEKTSVFRLVVKEMTGRAHR